MAAGASAVPVPYETVTSQGTGRMTSAASSSSKGSPKSWSAVPGPSGANPRSLSFRVIRLPDGLRLLAPRRGVAQIAEGELARYSSACAALRGDTPPSQGAQRLPIKSFMAISIHTSRFRITRLVGL